MQAYFRHEPANHGQHEHCCVKILMRFSLPSDVIIIIIVIVIIITLLYDIIHWYLLVVVYLNRVLSSLMGGCVFKREFECKFAIGFYSSLSKGKALTRLARGQRTCLLFWHIAIGIRSQAKSIERTCFELCNLQKVTGNFPEAHLKQLNLSPIIPHPHQLFDSHAARHTMQFPYCNLQPV